MLLDRPAGTPDQKVSWGSDVAAQMLRRFGIPYISLNPGASYRGLHDSLVNHLGNERPGILLCLHEDHSVAIAHGYAKATGEPMACVLHSNVGLLHGMMSLFNAWCDRVPMIVLGATGPVDSEKRRPWIDWIHTSRDQGAYIRSIVKWDDQPASAQALVESMCRANMATRAQPTAPVYICLDAGLQESRLDAEPDWPDLARFKPAEPSRPARGAIDEAAALLTRAQRPVILMGRGSREPQAWQKRIDLAERLGACVATDLKLGAVFPTDHPAHTFAPFNVLGKPARELLCEADVILALDWVDLGGALRQAKSAGKVGAKVISATLDQSLHTGANMEYQSLPAVDVPISATTDVVIEDLLAALGPGRKEPWKAQAAGQAEGRRRQRHHDGPDRHDADGGVQRSRQRHLLHARPRLADRHLAVPQRHGLSRQGRRRRLGLRAGAFGRLGARAAGPGPPRHLDARRRRLLHGRDRDLDGGAPPHSAARPRQQQPLLFQRRTAPADGGADARPRGEESLDRAAHGGSGARHRQARRGAGRGRHRASEERGRIKGRDLERRRGAQVRRRLRDRLPRRAAGRPLRRHRPPPDEPSMTDTAGTGADKPWPTELRLHKDRRTLAIAFDTGERFELPAEYLRVKSPSAEVQGHSPAERKTVGGKKNVLILEVNPVGNYAVRLVFDDLHSTGIFSWDYFLELGRNRDAYWQDYLDDLAGKGLSR